jgi:hypothetical protein
MRNKKENELIWEAFAVHEEGFGMLGRRKKTRETYGTSTQGEQDQLKRDNQYEKGQEQKEAAKEAGVADEFTDSMDDYGYMDEDYAEPLNSPRHPDNIERESNPNHSFIYRPDPLPNSSDNFTDEDVILDQNGKTIKRKDISYPTKKDASMKK